MGASRADCILHCSARSSDFSLFPISMCEGTQTYVSLAGQAEMLARSCIDNSVLGIGPF